MKFRLQQLMQRALQNSLCTLITYFFLQKHTGDFYSMACKNVFLSHSGKKEEEKRANHSGNQGYSSSFHISQAQWHRTSECLIKTVWQPEVDQ